MTNDLVNSSLPQYQNSIYVKQMVSVMKTLAILLFSFFYFTNLPAQDNVQAGLTDNEITQLSSNLAMKLLLSESQTKSVEDLLANYRSDLSKVMSASVKEAQNKIMTATNEKIVALLDSKQKMKFNVVGPDWWESVFEATNN